MGVRFFVEGSASEEVRLTKCWIKARPEELPEGFVVRIWESATKTGGYSIIVRSDGHAKGDDAWVTIPLGEGVQLQPGKWYVIGVTVVDGQLAANKDGAFYVETSPIVSVEPLQLKDVDDDNFTIVRVITPPLTLGINAEFEFR
ncbi:MAG TPA: hypothetical protein GXX57_11560 [Firmicutes bacterium]|nr:hypothetical protein [Bacillota bacterium]